MPSLNCKRILVVRTDRIGDVVLTTPVFKALRIAYPSATITVLVTPVTADLVRGNPYIDDVMVDDRNGKNKGVWGAMHLARAIRQRDFDTAFIFHTKRRTNMACFLAGIPHRIGYKNGKFGFLLTIPVKDERHQGKKHEAEYCLDLLKQVGIADAGLDILVASNREAEQWAMDWVQANGMTPGDLIAIHPGASDATRLWPAASYAKLIDTLAKRYPFKIALLGGQDAVPVVNSILALTKTQVLNLTGQTTVAQTASILRRGRLLLSCDSGPLHMAAGVGIPVVCVFLRNQPGINPTRWRPLGPRAILLTNKPGEEVLLDKKGNVASGKMDSITVDEVLEAIERIFSQDSQSLFYW